LTLLPALVWSVAALTRQGPAPAHTVEAAPAAAAPLCRFSVNFLGDEWKYDVSPLRIGWYINYRADKTPTHPNGAEYAPIINFRQTGPDADDWAVRSPADGDIASLVAGNPGGHFLIANEPDRRFVQDDLEPHVYANAYHALYHQIKALDPTAQIVAGNIVQPTELRLRYLDLVLASYRAQFGEAMPVDAWGAHNFILREMSCDYDPLTCWGAGIPPGMDDPYGELIEIDENDDMTRFTERIVAMRRWMRDRGYRYKPLFIDEYGVLFPFDFGYPPERVNDFMDATFNYMRDATNDNLGYPYDDNRLVQRFSWYSSSHDPFEFNGRLWNPDTLQLTEIGQNYASYVAPLAGTVDLVPVRLQTIPSIPFADDSPADITLTARIANQGSYLNIPGATPVVVRFYNGNPDAGGTLIGSQTINVLTGCGETAAVSVVWPNVPAGRYTLYVRVDPADAIDETNENNNTLSRVLFTADEALFLPAFQRLQP
jgi:hypothetical protein